MAPIAKDEIFAVTPTNALLVTFNMVNLPKMDSGIGAKSDAYFLLKNQGGQLLHRSEVVAQDLNPKFAPFLIHILEPHSHYCLSSRSHLILDRPPRCVTSPRSWRTTGRIVFDYLRLGR